MAERLEFADALKVLGTHDTGDSAVLDFAEQLLNLGGGVVGASNLGSLCKLTVKHGRAAVARIGEKISGVSRYGRTERIMAARQIIFTVAFFETLDELSDDPSSPVSVKDRALDPEQVWEILASYPDGAVPRLEPPSRSLGLHAGAASPGYTFQSRLVARLLTEGTSPSEDEAHSDEFVLRFLALVDLRYEEHYRRLAAEVPEFRVWADLDAHEATHRHLNALAVGMSGLEGTLRALSPGRCAGQRAQELRRIYRRVLDQPVLDSADAPDGLTLPPLGEIYLSPRTRMASADQTSLPAQEAWWQMHTLHTDIERSLAALLTQPDSTERPIVVLGHPGAGKSKLTQLLAARLPAEDFLPVRVELRSVQADDPIRRQIEQAVSDTLHTDVQWRDLAESAEGALPVVLLDGLDELLQATGVDRSDYLQQVQDFQQTQAALGHPVAVIVTTRTVVADRLRFPEFTPLLRLEPFGDEQITRLVEIWNAANAAALGSRGLAPLPAETALRHREFAEQPLLLLLLLLYDTDGNALQRADSGLSRAELYDRLLRYFAEREIAKHDPHLDANRQREAVDDELRRLEVTALAMFARRRQSVDAEGLNTDLTVLAPPLPEPSASGSMHARLTEADRMVGRFFFIHESRAQQDVRRSSYEFLHSTFGEYLVARSVVDTLRDRVTARAAARGGRFSTPLDDGPLYALTSFAALVGRAAVLEFTEELLRTWCTEQPDDTAACRALLLELFQQAPYPSPSRSFQEYEPVRLPITTRQGVYTANLVTLIALMCRDIDLDELFPGSSDVWHSWRGQVGLWRGLPRDEWYGLVDTLRIRHLGYWRGGGEEDSAQECELPRSVLSRETQVPVNVGECVGYELHSDVSGPLAITNPYSLTVPFEGTTSRLLRSMALSANGTASRLVVPLLPYLEHIGSDLVTWLLESSGQTIRRSWDLLSGTTSHPGEDRHATDKAAATEAYDVLTLRTEAFPEDFTREFATTRLARYSRLLLGTEGFSRVQLTALRQAAADLAWIHDDPSPAYDLFEEFLHSYVTGFLRDGHVTPAHPPITSGEVAPLLADLKPLVDEATLDGFRNRLAEDA